MVKKELFVGNLDRDIERRKIEDVFEKYGKVLKCEIKNRGPGAAFAFLEFEEERDAEDALNAENGKDLSGQAMIVQWARSKENDRPRGDFDRRGGGGGRDSRGGNGFRGGRGGGGRFDGRSNECYNCHETGHIARDCRKPRNGGGGGGGSGGGRRYDNGGSRSNGGSGRYERENRSSRRDRSRDRSRSRSR